MQWRRDRVVLPLQASLFQSPESKQLANNARDKNGCKMGKAVVIEDACVGASEESLPVFSALSERQNLNSTIEHCSHSAPNKLKSNEISVTDYESNYIFQQALISAREEIINLLAMNLRSPYDSCLVRDGFIVQFDEDVCGLGCHVGDSYASTSHLFLEDTQICLKSGTLHYNKTSCAAKQQYYLDDLNNSVECDDNIHEEREYNNNYECQYSREQQKLKQSHARHLEKLSIYTTKWERSTSYFLQNSIISNDNTSPDAQDVDLHSLHRLHQQNNNYHCSTSTSSCSNYDMSEFIGLSRSGVHKFMIANGGSEIVRLSHCHCTDEINVDVTCTDDWGEHCSVVGLSNGELVVVDWRCSRSNNTNSPVLLSSVPRPPWEYTSRSRVIRSASKNVNTAAITSCAAFESNYRVLAGLKDHHGSLIITDLRRPANKDDYYCSKYGKITSSNKTRKQLANCHHSREKWEKMIISQFVNGAGCLPTGHPISEIVHCPGNVDRVGLVDIRGQAMFLSMNALEHGQCSLHEHDYKYPSYEQELEEQQDTNRWNDSSGLPDSIIGTHNKTERTVQLHDSCLKRKRGSEGNCTKINNFTKDNEENNNEINIIDVDAFVDGDSSDNNYSSDDDEDDRDRSKGQETNNVNGLFYSSNVASMEIPAWSSSSSSTCLILEKENTFCKGVHSFQGVQNVHPHLIYEMALRSLSPLLSADEQTILRLQNVQMQLESKRNKIARRCVFSPDGKLLVHSIHSLLGISVMPVSYNSFHQSSLLTSHESITSAAKASYSMETFRVHHKVCCNRKGDAVVNVSVTGDNVLSVTTMLGQT